MSQALNEIISRNLAVYPAAIKKSAITLIIEQTPLAAKESAALLVLTGSRPQILLRSAQSTKNV